MPFAIPQTTCSTPTAQVINLGSHPKVLPVGTEVFHAEHGWALVEQVRDNERLIRWYRFENLAPGEFYADVDDDGNPIVEEMEITSHREWVSIAALRRVQDPAQTRPPEWQRLKQLGMLHPPIRAGARRMDVPETCSKVTHNSGML